MHRAYNVQAHGQNIESNVSFIFSLKDRMIIIKNMRNHAKEIQYTLSKGPRKMSKMMEKGVKIEIFENLGVREN